MSRRLKTARITLTTIKKGNFMKHDNANDNLRVYSDKETHAAGVELRVWWIPQVPMPPFVYPVPTLQAAKMLCEALAQYDLFQ